MQISAYLIKWCVLDIAFKHNISENVYIYS